MSFCQTVACAQCAFDPCYARVTVVRARFLAGAFSDGSYLAHVNGAYLRHVTFCIVGGPPLFVVSPISQRGPASVRGPLPTLRDRRDDEQRGSPYDAKCNVAEIGAVNIGEIGAVRNAAAKKQCQAGPRSTTATLKGLNKRAVEYNLRPLF